MGCIILGRREDDRKVHEWLTAAAAVPGFIGFVVGRTSFWQSLVDFRAAESLVTPPSPRLPAATVSLSKSSR